MTRGIRICGPGDGRTTTQRGRRSVQADKDSGNRRAANRIIRICFSRRGKARELHEKAVRKKLLADGTALAIEFGSDH